MNKLILSICTMSFASCLLAQNADVKTDVEATPKKIQWYETTKDSYVFIKKDSIREDEKQPHLKTAIMAVNIPKAKDRKADPKKTLLNNDTELSYLTDITVNCTDKTSRIGNQFLYEGFFGKGELLQSEELDTNSAFVPLKGVDGEAIWEIVCQPKK